MRTLRTLVCATLFGAAFQLYAAVAAPAQPVDASLFSALHWRMVGPFRGGRAVAVSGVVGDPRTFYFGAVGGGVWKTENAGRTWRPLMDGQPVASIGAIAVAPSDPSVVYAGSGEADMRSDIIHGNGMYVSRDAGATWKHIGLDDSRQIGRILVDPHDPNTLLVAALGHAYGPNEMRGVYRSTDGGASWTRVLYVDSNTGAIDLSADPAMHEVFASLWQTRRPPWSVYPPSRGPNSGLYVSADDGKSWKPVRGGGFPQDGLGKVGIAVAPSDPKRVYAVLDAKEGGVYRSDDAGSTWRLADSDPRLWTRCWYFCHIAVDPKDPAIVYVSDTAFYRSTDGGGSFTAIKGSPDGDDFHQLWIDPATPSRMVLGSDQGVAVSLDGAQTWSSWFNQPTAQFYHVVADNAFPYRLFGAQQDSGAAMVPSRSDHAGIEERDWRPLTPGGESNSIAPDPDDTNVVYGDFVSREDLHSNQTRSLAPTVAKPGNWRAEWTMPLTFGPGHRLYASRQAIFQSTDGGLHWQRISPDLARPNAGVPATLDPATAADADGPEPRGVVYAIAPVARDPRMVWAGTDDGLVYLTRDAGTHWRNVTPGGMSAWSHVDWIEASPFDANVAWIAVDRHRLDDDKAYVYVTRNGGRSWRRVDTGIPDGSFVWVVREDPQRRGLLYAGTETGVFVSFDGGDAWQPLQLNLPTVPVHDLIVHGGDVAIATHGRAFWILDDVAPLRALAENPSRGARLFAPQNAVRTRDPNDEAEASPPETPLGQNPPNGAYIDYVVPAGVRGPIALDILDAQHAVVRHWSSSDKPEHVDPKDFEFPAYWIQAPVQLSAEPGMHRFVWDFHMVDGDGPLAPPGTYQVRLAVEARTLAQRLVLARDPRVHATDADLIAQAAFATTIGALQQQVASALAAARTFRARAKADVVRIDALAGKPPVNGRQNVPFGRSEPGTLQDDNRLLGELQGAVESADSAPTPTERAAWQALRPEVERHLAAWKAFSATK